MDEKIAGRSGKAALFNSPFEAGFRATVLLAELYPSVADLQRLVFFDYLLIHSRDVGGPPSLHPATPYRSQEYAVRREIMRHGLLIMAGRGLVEIAVNPGGIEYSATEVTIPFLDRLIAPYKKKLNERAEWVASKFSNHTVPELAALFSNNLGRWGTEFVFMRDFSEDLSVLDERTGNGIST
jgi:hypothetical protein